MHRKTSVAVTVPAITPLVEWCVSDTTDGEGETDTGTVSRAVTTMPDSVFVTVSYEAVSVFPSCAPVIIGSVRVVEMTLVFDGAACNC